MSRCTVSTPASLRAMRSARRTPAESRPSCRYGWWVRWALVNDVVRVVADLQAAFANGSARTGRSGARARPTGRSWPCFLRYRAVREMPSRTSCPPYRPSPAGPRGPRVSRILFVFLDLLSATTLSPDRVSRRHVIRITSAVQPLAWLSQSEIRCRVVCQPICPGQGTRCVVCLRPLAEQLGELRLDVEMVALLACRDDPVRTA